MKMSITTKALITPGIDLKSATCGARARCSRLSGAPPSPERAGLGASCVALAADEEVHREEGADEHPRDEEEARRRGVATHARLARAHRVHRPEHDRVPVVARRAHEQQRHRLPKVIERAKRRVEPDQRVIGGALRAEGAVRRQHRVER